jgi:selenocysteine-specific elongation factor
MSRLVAGVIGHVDHGKTALVRALTGRDTDRLAEEKRRGVSIALGFAHLGDGADVQVDVIDMPGHEKFVRTMIGGASGIDAVLLVVSAAEGIKPQTVEHVEIAGLLGLRQAMVAITMCDLVPDEVAQDVAAQVAVLLERAGLQPLPPMLTSPITGRGIDALRTAVLDVARSQTKRESHGRAFLPIDRAFAITGHGPVVTGTLCGAPIATGNMLELLPMRRKVRARSVQVHGQNLGRAEPGQRVAINLRGVDLAQLERGMALAEPGAVPLSEWITIAIRAVAGAPALKNGARLSALVGTSEADARLRLLDGDVLEPGESGFAQLHFAKPIATPVGQHAILRLPAPVNTVAGGKVLEVAVRRQKRGVPETLARLSRLRDLAPLEIVAAEVEHAGPDGTTLDHLAQISGHAPWKIAEHLRELPIEVTSAGLVAPCAALERLATALPRLLAQQTEGLTQTALRVALPGFGGPVIDEALDRLIASGTIVRRASRYALPRPDRDRAQAMDAASLSDRIAEALHKAGLTPPLPKEIAVDPPAAQAIERLLRAGVLIRAVDRAKAKELLFHRDAIAEARQRLAPLLGTGPGLLVTEIAGALQISRKFVMPLLNHLDTIRFTMRDGDRRLLHPSQQTTREDQHDQAAQEHV